jgi:hypothetical protein
MNAAITGSKKKFAWQDIAPTNHEVARQDMALAIEGLFRMAQAYVVQKDPDPRTKYYLQDAMSWRPYGGARSANADCSF